MVSLLLDRGRELLLMTYLVGAAGMSTQDILIYFDELTETDIYAALSYTADRENKIYQIAV